MSDEKAQNSKDYRKFPEISSRAFEHPADRMALTALRKMPGFDMILRKLIGLIGERSLHNIYLASSVRVSDAQFSDLNAIYEECIATLDMAERPDLYVAQTPFVNAGAVGVERPFVVLNSATLRMLSDQELRFIIGHELGHILAGHVLFKTMFKLLLRLSLMRFGIPLGRLAILAIIAALSEWDRKSEHSSDRAGLLCCQDPQTAYTVFMKLAGGRDTMQMNVDEFVKQAEDYKTGGDQLDSIYKILNLLERSHPFHVLRLAELRDWVEEGAYGKILDGEYLRREEEESASVYEELKESARNYREAYERSKDPLFQFIRDVSSEVTATSSRLFGQIRSRFSRRDKGEEEEE